MKVFFEQFYFSVILAVTNLVLMLHKKWNFSLRIFSVNLTADLVTFTDEIFNGKLYIFCSVIIEEGYRLLDLNFGDSS